MISCASLKALRLLLARGLYHSPNFAMLNDVVHKLDATRVLVRLLSIRLLHSKGKKCEPCVGLRACAAMLSAHLGML